LLSTRPSFTKPSFIVWDYKGTTSSLTFTSSNSTDDGKVFYLGQKPSRTEQVA